MQKIILINTLKVGGTKELVERVMLEVLMMITLLSLMLQGKGRSGTPRTLTRKYIFTYHRDQMNYLHKVIIIYCHTFHSPPDHMIFFYYIAVEDTLEHGVNFFITYYKSLDEYYNDMLSPRANIQVRHEKVQGSRMSMKYTIKSHANQK